MDRPNERAALTADAFLALIERHLAELWQAHARSENRSLRAVLRSAEALLAECAGMDVATFRHALQGVGLGTAAFLAWLGIAKAKGRVSAPAWGWEQTSLNEVLHSVAGQAVGHLAVAWNEEMVFRGYGFDTVRAALGQGGRSRCWFQGLRCIMGWIRSNFWGCWRVELH